MSILVIAEHDNKVLNGSTLSTIGAATQLDGDIHVLVAGQECDDVITEAAKIQGVSKVLAVSDEQYSHFLAENVASLVATMAADYSYILAPSTTTGKNVIPRIAASLDVQPLSDVISVESADTFKRPIYAGNVIATVKSNDKVKVLTIRSTAFDEVAIGDSACTVENVAAAVAFDKVAFDHEELAKSDRPELTSAKVVISGGRGLQNGENFELLYALADKLGAAVGASRAAVDAGFVPNDMQVGQTGKIVAPDLYIAVGISGAIQHLAGMKDSKTIVAINKDEDAPIFQVADYGLVMDLFDAIPEISAQLDS